MHARMSEVHHLGDKLEQRSVLEPAYHVESSQNIADLAMRRDGRLQEIGIGSLWQKGPSWLELHRPHWPTSRSFAREEFLDKERKSSIRILLSRPKKVPVRNPLVVSALDNCSTFSEALHRLTKNVLDISRTPLGRMSGAEPADRACGSREKEQSQQED